MNKVKEMLGNELQYITGQIEHTKQVLENNRLSKIRLEDELKVKIEFLKDLEKALMKLSCEN